jgi:hypothetical protein
MLIQHQKMDFLSAKNEPLNPAFTHGLKNLNTLLWHFPLVFLYDLTHLAPHCLCQVYGLA